MTHVRAAVGVVAMMAFLGDATIAREGVPRGVAPSRLDGPPALVAELERDPRPLALAAADLDEDGAREVVVGYALAAGGALGIWRGPLARRGGLAVEIPDRPDLVVAADLDGDGHADVACAERGGRRLHVALGDGRGRVTAIVGIDVDLAITALATADVNRADGLVDLLVGGQGARGGELAVLEGPAGVASAVPERIAIDGVVSAIHADHLNDDRLMDVLVWRAGGDFHVIRGRDRRLTAGAEIAAAVEAAHVELVVDAAAGAIDTTVGAGDPDRVTLGTRLDGDLLEDVVVARRGLLAPEVSPGAPRATFTVTTTADAGAGSLRQAILDANGSSGADTITFAIPGAGPYVISPGSALPPITGTVSIDGNTQPGYALTPIVQLEGSLAGAGVDGLAISAGASVVRGLVIRNFGGAGIRITGPGGNLVEECYVGTDVAGSAAAPNAAGIVVVDSPGNAIGGTVPTFENVISGNTGSGIQVTGASATGNQIHNNVVGTNAAGIAALPNAVGVTLAAPGCTIGGGASIDRNVIAGNAGRGIQLDAGATSTIVQNNFIGATFSNGTDGIGVAAATCTIGGSTTAVRNIVSANLGNGVVLEPSATGTLVQGNCIGTGNACSGDNGNVLDGVRIEASSTVGGTVTPTGQGAPPGNVISGNNGNGIRLASGASSVLGNVIGLAANGTTALGNSVDGILVESSSNTIGGNVAGARNIVSGNLSDGIQIAGASATGNTITGNRIGTDLAGSADRGNTVNGVNVVAGAGQSVTGNTIGGDVTTPGSGLGNLISGNNGSGVAVSGSGATGNLVAGNLIGLNAAGSATLANSSAGVVLGSPSTTVGGDTTARRNVISGNTQDGVRVTGSVAGNQVKGNYIGLNPGGASALGNGGNGVLVSAAPTGTVIGGATSTPGTPPGNVISANGSDGIELSLNSSGTTVTGNVIGLSATTGSDQGNTLDGILVSNSSGNTIGGATADLRNVVSGNNSDGIEIATTGGSTSGNAIQGNYVGLAVDGTTVRGNSIHGVRLNGVAGLTVGGSASVAGTPPGNVVSGNLQCGVAVEGASATGNVVAGNAIGTDAAGAIARGNGDAGVAISGSSNTVGGDTSAEANLVSGNGNGQTQDSGINLTGASNQVKGNLVGTNLAGSGALPNNPDGIVVSGASAVVGPGNVVSGNVDDGVQLAAATPVVRGNRIGTDATGTAAVPNLGAGVEIVPGATGSVVGGLTAPEANLVASNVGSGVVVLGGSNTGHRIRGNSLVGNGGLGIDLGAGPVADGVTANDPGDADTGANGLQNFPVITGATFNPGPGTTSVTGTLDSIPNSTFDVDFYTSASADPSGFGEGQTYRGSTVVTTNGAGTGVIAATLAGDATSVLTATATDAAGSTSELCAAFTAAPGVTPKEASPAGDLLAVRGSGSSVDITYTAACGATDHAVYVDAIPLGPIAWDSAHCALGTSGSASFDPGDPPPGSFVAFVVVGHDATREGSYGKDSAGAERPEATGVGACDRPQQLAGSCP